MTRKKKTKKKVVKKKKTPSRKTKTLKLPKNLKGSGFLSFTGGGASGKDLNIERRQHG